MQSLQEKNVYLDQAATSFPKPESVTQSMLHYMTQIGCNVNRGSYSAALDAEDILFDTREQLSDFFHGDDCRNTIFTANVTTSLNVILKGLLKPGDHVLVSSMEHNAVMRPLQQLKKSGVDFDRIPCDSVGQMDLDSLGGLCKNNTRAVISTHASNVFGTLQPLSEIGEFCREKGLVFIVDSAQTAGIFPIDMQEMHIDALAFTGHKSLLGPQGTGGFLLKEHMVSQIEPLLCGGTGSISHTEEMPVFMPDRFEPGTPNLPGIFGLHAALDFLNKKKTETIRSHELSLCQQFLDGLSQIKKIQVIGPKSTGNRAPVISVQIKDMEIARAAWILDQKYHIQTRVGLHCAPYAHKALGTFPEGTLRFSFGYYNTSEETEYCLRALEEICYGI